MTDQELRALVRDAVARHLSPGSRVQPPGSRVAVRASESPELRTPPHPSHAIYLSVVNTTDACVIEPGVACNHCNYCRSHGH